MTETLSTTASLHSPTGVVAAEEQNNTLEKTIDDVSHEKALPGTPKLDKTSSDVDVDSIKASNKTNIEHFIARIISKEERDPNVVGGLVGLVLVLFCLPRLSWSTVIVGILGVGFGGFIATFYLLAVPEATRLQRAQTIANFGKHPDQRLEIIDRVPTWINAVRNDEEHAKGVHLDDIKEAEHQQVRISPDIDPMVEEMITFTLRDFVNVPIGLVSKGQHNIPLRASLVAMVMNMSHRLSNMQLPETALLGVFGLQNSFIVHLRAYRELSRSGLPIAEYVSTHANADSVLGRCYRKEERIKQFRSTAKAICQALLSKSDQQSPALFAVMQEIMATHALEATLEHMCDPDFVNLTIIDYFSTPAKTNLESSDIISGANGPATNKTVGIDTQPHEAPITALADSILMNAANLMDKSAFDNLNSNQGSQTPIHSSTPLKSSTIEETNGSSHSVKAELPRAPSAITLKDILKNKNDHMDTFQAFMSYLEVWDAMDISQFWIMTDLFHRQIEEGTLTDINDLRREATSIYETYCRPDTDHEIPGIKEAKGGKLIKNLKTNMQREPSICFIEPQQWALGVLETQYWTPFKIKQDNEKSAMKAKSRSLKQQSSPPTPTNKPDFQEAHLEENIPRAEQNNLPSSATILSEDSSNALNSGASESIVPLQSPLKKANWIQVSDMVNQRPKTLMSNSDLSYMIEVQIDEEQGWMVTRTFQQIEQLHAALMQQFPVVQRTTFPRWRLQQSDRVCIGLQTYLRAMLSIPEVSDSQSLTWFLSKEFDQNPGAIIPGTLQSPNSASILSFPPLSDSAFGVAAAQGAKTALRQASEASLSAGRFFKSLGSVVNSGGGSQLFDDRSIRGSFESERSIRSVSSSLTQSDQRNSNGALLSSGTSRLQEVDSDPHPTISNLSEINSANRRLSSMSTSSRTIDGFSPPLNTSLQSQSPVNSATLSQSPVDNGDYTFQQASGHTSSYQPDLPDFPHRKSVGSLSVMSSVSEASNMPASSTLPSQPSVPVPVEISSTESKKSQMSLLSSDELDLLIETTFTVLEDMMDFSKGQSIRRMTFGMLRELVRKSYRVAINQSFSAWVEQTTSHEKAVETVKWMKDDFFWPNGEWPIAPTASPQPVATPPPPVEKKDIFEVGEDKYMVGADGIAVKMSTESSQNTSDPIAPSANDPSIVEPTTGIRTLQEKEATREKARELFKMMLPGSLSTVLGKEAVSRGLGDVFEMFQIKELNMGLALSVLETTVRLIFTR
ncbi:hypothetical protein BGZ46_002267 [Entomortierella lignicola]|nr:hypothetical protein BGZ46_002267 [Entomortierella lignicola]